MKNQMSIKRILIANRGEIALRIISTCREMGIETITLYTDTEKDLPHAKLGDFNINLGSGPLSETYLNIDRIVEICREFSVDAIHPGYGFLSENAHFAKRLEKEKIIFIGPSADSIELMGDKMGSKKRLANLAVPLIPGYHGDDQGDKHLLDQAIEIGFPVLIKASAGGGGKGMRIVEKQDEFQSALESAKREAKNAFGDDRVLVEKFIQNPRHIEVQVLSDSHGQHFHLFERECSIQRRYQKVVEESPSISLHPETREKMTKAAVEITSGIGYLGAGTIEFILDDSDPKKQKFYFLEMNTRLQVEHPVTEMVTGVDLVAEQIRIAAGEKISFAQDDLKVRGHAIEVRVYAENPEQEFLPSTGKITKVGDFSPVIKGIRFDCGYSDGNEVTIDFDPMLAKVISYASCRDMAARKLIQALDQTPFFGVTTNRQYLKRILAHPEFLAGKTYTHFAKTYEADLLEKDISEEERNQLFADVIAAHYFYKKLNTVVKGPSKGLSNDHLKSWSTNNSFRNV